MKVNKTVFHKDRVWYLSIIKIGNEFCNFWSSHKRVGVPDNVAKVKFEKDHFKEVVELTKEKLQNKFLPQLSKQDLSVQKN